AFVANCADQCGGGRAFGKDQGVVPRRALPLGGVENRVDRLIQAGDLYISDPSYYHVTSGIGSRLTQPAAGRIAAREESVGQAFVDNDDAGSVSLVVFIEQASFDQWGAESLKIALVDDANVGFNLPSGRWNRIAYDIETRRVSANERQNVRRA